MSRMRDECIALEAAHIAASSFGKKESKTFQEIANEAIAKVDEWAAKGDLELLYREWTREHE